jgi:cytochrome c oxidase assembly factor CtaG
MHATLEIGEIIAMLLLVGFAAVYLWGWRRLHRAMPSLATKARLIPFGVAMLALTGALVWPLPDWSNYLLAMRSLQKVLVCMVAAPMLWLSIPVHVLVWGVHGRLRHGFVALMGQGRARRIARAITQPLAAWLFYVSVFLFWHDPSMSQFFLGEHATHAAAPWLLLGAALLFWWPVVDTGPRFHRGFPASLLVVYLISVEIANMVAGITIAFSTEPLYPYYPLLRAQLAPDALPWSQSTDQIAGGAIVWIGGSFVYIPSIVFVLLRLFRKEASNSPLHLPNWDSNDKFIAPGLEHRVPQNDLHKVDLSHH